MYAWQELALFPVADREWRRSVLFRRSLSDASDVAAYTVFAPAHTTLMAHVQVAGKRWTVEERIQVGKGEVGLDHDEVRSWTGWYRHITLAMVAEAFLAVVRAESGTLSPPFLAQAKKGGNSSLARFKAQRNAGCDEAVQKSGICSGNSSWRVSAVQGCCCSGRGGGVAISGGRDGITIASEQEEMSSARQRWSNAQSKRSTCQNERRCGGGWKRCCL